VRVKRQDADAASLHQLGELLGRCRTVPPTTTCPDLALTSPARLLAPRPPTFEPAYRSAGSPNLACHVSPLVRLGDRPRRRTMLSRTHLHLSAIPV
jgi:hypothetical protein